MLNANARFVILIKCLCWTYQLFHAVAHSDASALLKKWILNSEFIWKFCSSREFNLNILAKMSFQSIIARKFH